MGVTTWLIFFVLLHSTTSRPQTSPFRVPDVEFSTAQEVNGLEPSAIPELEKRSYLNSGNFLEATVEEVQNILKASPDLPRLTKGEILDLIENITKQDMEKLRSLNRNRTGKSVLLVMPYSPKKNGENIEDLYTKKPITQLIDNDNKTVEAKKTNKNKKPSFNSKKDGYRTFGRNITKVNYRVTLPTVATTQPTADILYDTTSAMTTEATTVEVTTFRRRVRPPRTRPTTTTRPTRRRRRPTYTPINYTKENQQHLNIHTDKFLPENAVRVTRPPTYRFTRRTTKATTTTTEAPDLNIAESYQEYVYVDPSTGDMITKNSNRVPEQVSDTHDELTRVGPVFRPISNQLLKDEEPTTTPEIKTFKPFSANFVIPEGFEHIFKDLNLDNLPTEEKPYENGLRRNTDISTTTTTTELPITPMPEFGEVVDNLSPDMKNLLMTFGLIPNPEEKKRVRMEETPYRLGGLEDKPESYMGFKPLPEDDTPNEELDSLLASFGLGRNARRAKKIRKRVDESPSLDLSVVPESMMGIVENLGLSNDSPSTIKVPEPSKSHSYVNDKVSVEDIEEINELPNRKPAENVTSVGILPLDDFSEENSTLSEFFDDQYEATTESLSTYDPELLETNETDSRASEPVAESGIDQVIAEGEYVKVESTTRGTSTSVVFNPTDQKIVEKEREQLEKLMELIKALKNINGTATEEDFKNFDLETLKEFTKVLNESQRTTFGEQIENEINPLNDSDDTPKFKPKRQETTTSEPVDTTETKLEPNFLEGSFGKLPEEEVETPTSKKYGSGVYYMIDWNTFLEVDNTKGKHVNLRFQPKVGDPNRFYAINNN